MGISTDIIDYIPNHRIGIFEITTEKESFVIIRFFKLKESVKFTTSCGEYLFRSVLMKKNLSSASTLEEAMAIEIIYQIVT